MPFFRGLHRNGAPSLPPPPGEPPADSEAPVPPPLAPDWKDVLAIAIAMLQVVLPWVLAVAAIFGVLIWVLLRVLR